METDFYSDWFLFLFYFTALIKNKQTQMLSFEEKGFQLKPSSQVL